MKNNRKLAKDEESWTWRGDNFLDAPSWVHGRCAIGSGGVLFCSGDPGVYMHVGDTLVMNAQGVLKAG